MANAHLQCEQMNNSAGSEIKMKRKTAKASKKERKETTAKNNIETGKNPVCGRLFTKKRLSLLLNTQPHICPGFLVAIRQSHIHLRARSTFGGHYIEAASMSTMCFQWVFVMCWPSVGARRPT